MPSPKNSNRRVRQLTEKASSFHCRVGFADAATSSSFSSTASFGSQLRRPKTVPDLLTGRGVPFETMSFLNERQQAAKPTKVLMNVTIQGSVGAVQVLISPESTVGDLIAAALSQYGKEARRPMLAKAVPSMFNLHYSQFTLECLEREDKLIELGSRNFFMCPATNATSDSVGTTSSSSSSSCSTQADLIVSNKSAFAWPKFMDFML